MCGIFGVLAHDRGERPEWARLEETARRLHHRGPDAKGIHQDDQIGLVHTRLSLLDLDPRSNQPFPDSSGRFLLVYNGEIFNHADLRALLEAEGVEFRTTGDTELVLHWLLHRGTGDALRDLEGFFAFALYDTLERKLTLARDRFGIKPLLVSETDQRFLFSSEVDALSPWMPFEPDLLSISGYLQNHHMPSRGFTFFRGVRIVNPGEVIEIRAGERAVSRQFFNHWEFVDPNEIERLSGLSDDRILDEVDDRLNEAVRMQLLADAPVGGLCSGGVDSAVVLAIARRYHEHLQVFHVDVAGPDSEFDEARALAKYLDLDFRYVRSPESDFIDYFPETMAHCAHPFTYQPNAVPSLRLSRLVQEHGIKAVISGQGSDECFIGYPWQVFKPLDALKLVASRPVAVFKRLLGRGKTLTNDGGSGRLVTDLHSRFETSTELEEIRRRLEGIKHRGAIATLDLLGYHLRTVLHVNDAISMAASVEARPPFLDSRLVHLAVNLPFRCKNRIDLRERDPRHRFTQSKWAVRQIARRYLPREICDRPKRGFPASAFKRMRVDPAFFEGSWLARTFELGPDERKLLMAKAKQPLTSKLLHLEVWARTCLEGTPRQTIADSLRRHVGFENA